MRRLILGVFFLVFLIGGFWWTRERVVGDGTYDNLGTSDAADGSSDALTWDQGNVLTIDKYGKYIMLTQNRVGPTSHFTWSNNNGDTWTQGGEGYGFLTRGSIAYDSINDKIHVIWSATDASDGIIYRRYGITRDGSNNITAIAREDSGTVNLQLDVSGGGCSFEHPSALWVNDGSSDGLLVAIWSKSNCANVAQIRGSMRRLTMTAADGVAGNWVALDGTPDSFPDDPPNVAADKIYSATQGNVGNSIKIRGGSGARKDDLYVFAQQANSGGVDQVLAYRAVWNSGASDWSGGWQSPVVMGDALQTSGYNLKWQLISKVVLDSVNDRLYVGWARWKTGGDGDTVSFAYLNNTDVASSTFDAYSAMGTASYAPTLGAAFDGTLGNFIISYIESTTNGDNGSIDYKAFDGSTLGTQNRFYTSPGGSDGENGSADIPVMYQGRVNDRLLFIFRINGALPPTGGDPHTIDFGFQILATPTPTPTPTVAPTNTPTPTPSSGGGGSSNSPQGSTTNPPVCNTQAPGSAPDLYAAVAQNGSEIMLYFSEASDPLDHYALTYGDASNDYTWGVDNIGGVGSRTYIVGGLNPGTTYYFRVRGGNGCAVGAWSNEISGVTSGSGIIPNALNITDSELTPGDGARGGVIENEEGENAEVGEDGYNLSITVKDQMGVAVSGATVTVHSEPQIGKTNDQGIVEFSGLAQGEHTVQIAYDGYRGEQSVYLSGDQETYNLDITVEKENNYGNILLGVLGGVILAGVIFGGYYFFYRKRKKKKQVVKKLS